MQPGALRGKGLGGDVRADEVEVVDLEPLGVVPEDGEGVVVDVESGDEGRAEHRRADREDSAAAAEVRQMPGKCENMKPN